MKYSTFRQPIVMSAALAMAITGAATAQDAAEFPAVDLPPVPETAQTVPGRIIVKLRETGLDQFGRLSTDQVVPLGLEAAPEITSGGELIYRVNVATLLNAQNAQELGETVQGIASEIAALPDVEYAQPDWELYPFLTPGDAHYPLQWHYHDFGTGPDQSPGGIGLPAAWDVTTGDGSVTVSVIDTGILDNHADVVSSGNIRSGYDMISDPSRAADGDGRDADPFDAGDAVAAGECGPGSPARGNSWHGSHVAGTVGVGASDNSDGIAGVAWNVGVQSIRVLGKCGGSTSDINDAIRWAAGLPVPGVPANPTPADVINMSLGAPVPCSASPSTQAAINDAVSAGTTVVVAAGNDTMSASNAFPASCANVITVAASDARGHLARYSNFGPAVEIMAPGGDVQRDDNGDGQPDGVLSLVSGGYAWYNGTSMAAPHVAGAAALMLANDPSLTTAEILAELQATATPRTTTECSEACGAGLLNLVLEETDPPEPPDPRETAYRYDAKFICGQRETILEGGKVGYDTIVNVMNPSQKDIMIEKRLSLAVPPGRQRPGDTRRIAEDELPAGHALAADCEDVGDRLGNPVASGAFVDGFLTVLSPVPLEVRAVYRTDAADENGGMISTMDVEDVERTESPKKER
ncbi:S8 family peptidase [Maritimibacter dapengensis]|uniref:S8 family peptidase n=1 Tax=Maritimibacter dapengensis TaxID=2836868 RepID=A0ABS6SXH3_9RHOB|nr:S8 family peptidase [Maritimibacter dapengensis]MBV7377615.1 S8 family peptidase [Maritimibacter dapengensis]